MSGGSLLPITAGGSDVSGFWEHLHTQAHAHTWVHTHTHFKNYIYIYTLHCFCDSCSIWGLIPKLFHYILNNFWSQKIKSPLTSWHICPALLNFEMRNWIEEVKRFMESLTSQCFPFIGYCPSMHDWAVSDKGSWVHSRDRGLAWVS